MSKVKVSLRLCSHETCSRVVLPHLASRGANLETPSYPPIVTWPECPGLHLASPLLRRTRITRSDLPPTWLHLQRPSFRMRPHSQHGGEAAAAPPLPSTDP